MNAIINDKPVTDGYELKNENMYKTIINGKPVTDRYDELIKLIQGFIGHPFEKVK